MWVCVLVIVFCVVSFTAIFPVCFSKPLEVHDFPRTQEFDGLADFLIVNESQDIVVGGSCFLFCGHILCQIGNDIALGLELTGIERNAASRLRPDTKRVVGIIVGKAGFLDFLHGEIFRQLVNDRCHHL